MIIQKIQQFGKRLLLAETSVRKLALSTSLGIFIAFSPFVGLHTVMAVALCWLLSFNFAVTMMVSSLINNPWTMVPVYSCDYVFGKWLSCLCKVDLMACAPRFFLCLFEPLGNYLGFSGHSIWTFFIGGNVLSVLLAIIMYPPIKWCFERCARNYNKRKLFR